VNDTANTILRDMVLSTSVPMSLRERALDYLTRPVVVGDPQAAAEEEISMVAQRSGFHLILTAYDIDRLRGLSKVNAIKRLRENFNLTLADAFEFVNLLRDRGKLTF
jgi:ribosomal protein L7/L12